jgi:hypothetical protein
MARVTGGLTPIFLPTSVTRIGWLSGRSYGHASNIPGRLYSEARFNLGF